MGEKTNIESFEKPLKLSKLSKKDLEKNQKNEGYSKSSIVKNLRRFKEGLKKNIAVEKIIFFGSRANGEPKIDSDIDLIVVSKNFEGKAFRYRQIGFYENWDLDYPVDFLCYTPEEFKKLKKQITIVREAVRNGIEI